MLHNMLRRGKTLKTLLILRKEDCYQFCKGCDKSDITAVPNFLKQPLSNLYNSIADINISQFEICTNKCITITIIHTCNKEQLEINHDLIWNKKFDVYEKNKDSVLGNNCIYRIGINTHQEFW